MAPGESLKESSFPQLLPRKRFCLLKGCERIFYPRSIWSRYCSAQCAVSARHWSVIRAQRKYRSNERGRQRRAGQAREYRQRRKYRESSGTVLSVGGENVESEGDHCEKICCSQICSRPGCYAPVEASARTPLKKFCSASCFQALRRVRQRERYWGRILAIERKTVRWSAERQLTYVSHIASGFL